jgi:hypothetical protein
MSNIFWFTKVSILEKIVNIILYLYQKTLTDTQNLHELKRDN